MFSPMIQKHFLNPTQLYMLLIDIKVTFVINIITLRPLYYVHFSFFFSIIIPMFCFAPLIYFNSLFFPILLNMI